MTKHRVTLFCVSMMLSMVIVSYGQTPTAMLSGIVRDEQGAAIPGAVATVKNNATGKARSVSTEDEGRYAFTSLEPGSYSLSVMAPGYKSMIQNGLSLTVGGSTVSDVTLSVGVVSDQVTVEAQGQLIEPNKVEISRVIARQEIESLPNIGPLSQEEIWGSRKVSSLKPLPAR